MAVAQAVRKTDSSFSPSFQARVLIQPRLTRFTFRVAGYKFSWVYHFPSRNINSRPEDSLHSSDEPMHNQCGKFRCGPCDQQLLHSTTTTTNESLY